MEAVVLAEAGAGCSAGSKEASQASTGCSAGSKEAGTGCSAGSKEKVACSAGSKEKVAGCSASSKEKVASCSAGSKEASASCPTVATTPAISTHSPWYVAQLARGWQAPHRATQAWEAPQGWRMATLEKRSERGAASADATATTRTAVKIDDSEGVRGLRRY